MNTTMPMHLYAIEHMQMVGEYSKRMHHRDVSMYHTKKKEKK